MKLFLSTIGVMAELGIFSFIWLLLWVCTEFDVIRILTIDLILTILSSIGIFTTINEIAGEDENEGNK